MGPTFAETSTSRRSFAWLIGLAAASVIALVALVALRCEPAKRTRVQDYKYEQFKQYKPVKKCIDGRWVIAHERARH